MPFVSTAQRKYFHAAEARGEIKPSTVKEYDKESKGKKLPEYAPKLNKLGKYLKKKD